MNDIGLRYAAISDAIKKRNPLGTKIHNSWRAMRFTLKGRKAGNDPLWNDFNAFLNDMGGSHIEGHVLLRKDKSQPFSRKNCFWGDKSIAALTRENLTKVTYNNETLNIREWSLKLGINYNGLKKRYYVGNHTDEEILFGKKKRIRIWKNEDLINIRASKLISSYKIKDSKRGFSCDMDKPWFIENILSKNCHYCGDSSRVGADRIDNSKGHIKGNVLPCCPICNAIKGLRFTVSEMEQMGVMVRQIKSRWN